MERKSEGGEWSFDFVDPEFDVVLEFFGVAFVGVDGFGKGFVGFVEGVVNDLAFEEVGFVEHFGEEVFLIELG